MITGATRFFGLITDPVAIHTGVPMLHAQVELMLRFMGVAPSA